MRVATRTWLVWMLALVALPAAAGEPAFVEGEWQVKQGKWRFEDGELVCEGKGTSSLIYRKGFSARDLELAAEVKFLGKESSAGLVFRARGKSYYRDITFYQLEWYTEGHHHGTRLSLMRKTPRWKQIVKPLFEAPPMGRWIRFRVVARGERLTCFVDGKKVFETRDRAFLRPGQVGLHVFQARAVRFRRPTTRSFDK